MAEGADVSLHDWGGIGRVYALWHNGIILALRRLHCLFPSGGA